MKIHLLFSGILLFFFSALNAQWQARHNMTPAEYQAFFNDCRGQGLRPISVSGYTVAGNERYAAVFVKKSGSDLAARHGMSAAEFQNQFNLLDKQGYQLSFISGYPVNGQPKFAGLWGKKEHQLYRQIRTDCRSVSNRV